VGRAAPEAHRGTALGVASALGSLGQFAMLPIGQTLISSGGWPFALAGMGFIALVMVPLSAGVAGRPQQSANPAAMSMGGALNDALRHRGYILLFLGFFVCGFQVMFLATHLPAYIADQNFPPGMGATALATVGLFKVVGSYVWPVIAGRTSKSMTLAVMYLARAVVIGVFLLVPLSTASVLVFSAAIGFMWLATVPVTTALVGQIFGVRFVSTLFGIVFLGHQIGSFLGVWLGGYLYDVTGSYNVVWYLTIALGVVAALLHWPIDERRVDWALAEEPV
jgi:MFS family permease